MSGYQAGSVIYGLITVIQLQRIALRFLIHVPKARCERQSNSLCVGVGVSLPSGGSQTLCVSVAYAFGVGDSLPLGDSVRLCG
jgi:hypothetical protein